MKTGYDSINPLGLPAGGDFYLGYVDGRWPDYAEIARLHGNVPVYGLTVFASATQGQGTDVESGNASIDSATVATQAELDRGVDRPIVYCPASWVDEVVASHTAAGIDRARYRLVSAHYGLGLHICGPDTCRQPGCSTKPDGTQWTSLTDYDITVTEDSFLAATPYPGPTEDNVPLSAADIQAIATVTNQQVRAVLGSQEGQDRLVQGFNRALSENGSTIIKDVIAAIGQEVFVPQPKPAPAPSPGPVTPT